MKAEPHTLVPHIHGEGRPYASAAVFGGTIWTCGQVPTSSSGHTPDDMAEQVNAVFDNLEATLRAAGGGLHTLLKVTVYLADLDDFDAYNATYLSRLQGVSLPPRTTVEVSRFRGDKRIEMDVIAAVAALD